MKKKCWCNVMGGAKNKKNGRMQERSQRGGMNEMPDDLKELVEELRKGMTENAGDGEREKLAKEEMDVVRKYKTSDIYRALRKLRSDEVKRKHDLKNNYGKDSLQYIASLHNYYTISPIRKILEHEDMREVWNLMQREGKDRADKVLNILERYVQK